jgi:hypothetical protein
MNRAWLRNHAVRKAAVPLTAAFFAFLFQIPPSSNYPVIATEMRLVFVNATVQELETGAPVAELSYHDFLVFDNGHPTSILFFSSENSRDRRPITIWFLLSCPEQKAISRGSRLMTGKSQLFGPMLDGLGSNDTVGVAHWCGNGDAKIDLAPTQERKAPMTAIDAILDQNPTKSAKPEEGAAFQRTLELVADSRRDRVSLPVIVLLDDGGFDFAPDETEILARRLLYKGAVLYQITGELEDAPGSNSGTRDSSLHILCSESGGHVVRVQHEDYMKAMSGVLDTVKARYSLAVTPSSNDGQWHELQVSLTDSALAKHKPVRLEYGAGYLAVGSLSAIPPYSISYRQGQASTQLDPDLIHAIESPTLTQDIHFDTHVHGFVGEPYAAEFALQIDSSQISWATLPNGDRQSEISIAVASFSNEGNRLDQKIVKFEVTRDEAHLPITGDGPFTYSETVWLPANVSSVRLLVRDDATHRMGVRDFSVEAIMAAPKSRLVLK